jgi:AmmeMemoRadiSam system protein A
VPVCFAALMCHAPIVVPAVGGRRSEQCRRTTRAMREVAGLAVASKPDCVVLSSPHTPRLADRWAVRRGPHHGSLDDFGAASVRVELPALAVPFLPELRAERLDHGALVPLAFLWEAGWRGDTAILALPMADGGGAAVGRRIAELPGRVAAIASGDMSHRLIPGAPSGYEPRARDFDAAFVAALRDDDWESACGAEPRALAGEDVIASFGFAAGAAGSPRNAEVIAYEGPFGVGYCEAVLSEASAPPWRIARHAIRAAMAGRRYEPPSGGPGPHGVFVTLRSRGNLRGCIGMIEPSTDRLWTEIARVAPDAALADPRFPPVRVDEFDDLDIEISVLDPPKTCRRDELDPRRFGVVVRRGRQRGVLLPDLDGVDTIDTQVAIACRKAGIAEGDAVEYQRFTVSKFAPPVFP